jgi:ankyrin repeat protein
MLREIDRLTTKRNHINRFDSAASWPEVLDEIEVLKKESRSLPVKVCREINQAQQLLRNVWKDLDVMEPDCAPESSSALKFLRKNGNILRSGVGPVGDSPIHNCFLLKQYRLGMHIIRKFPDLVNREYENDLNPWKEVISKAQIDEDGGLYTGETVLHLAIGIVEKEVVEFLLQNGARLDSRANGRFFLPLWIPFGKSSNPPIRVINSVLFPFNLGARFNEYSRCYFGEFPLSFAASVGCVEICEALLYHQASVSDGVLGFLRRRDRFGNTGLHMAVIHNQKAVIDWLLEKEREAKGRTMHHKVSSDELENLYSAGQVKSKGGGSTGGGEAGAKVVGESAKMESVDLLEIRNGDGHTPLLLAAQMGCLETFQHVLNKMRTVAWEFGHVRHLPSFPFAKNPTNIRAFSGPSSWSSCIYV